MLISSQITFWLVFVNTVFISFALIFAFLRVEVHCCKRRHTVRMFPSIVQVAQFLVVLKSIALVGGGCRTSPGEMEVGFRKFLAVNNSF
jgi:hypothetical protein